LLECIVWDELEMLSNVTIWILEKSWIIFWWLNLIILVEAEILFILIKIGKWLLFDILEFIEDQLEQRLLLLINYRMGYENKLESRC